MVPQAMVHGAARASPLAVEAEAVTTVEGAEEAVVFATSIAVGMEVSAAAVVAVRHTQSRRPLMSGKSMGQPLPVTVRSSFPGISS
jgi:hypothetical protein